MWSNIPNDVVNIIYKYIHEHNIHRCNEQYCCTIVSDCKCSRDMVCNSHIFVRVNKYEKIFNYRKHRHTSSGYIFSINRKYIDETCHSYWSHGMEDVYGPLKRVQELPKNY